MGRIPTKVNDQLNWLEAHVTTWQTNKVALGISTTLATNFAGAVSTAREDYTAAITLREKSKSATLTANESLRLALRYASFAIGDIDSSAEQNTNPSSIYALADIAPPAPRSTIPPPGQPKDFKVTLNPSGGVTLNWKCENPQSNSAVVYTIDRRPIDGPTDVWMNVGYAGKRTFTDDSIPAGNGVVYRITPVRGQTVGTQNTLNVVFGVPGLGRSMTYYEGATKQQDTNANDTRGFARKSA
jgi:hypothetical protein